MTSACSIRVRGVVQGVGFRPFVFRLARENTLTGWVLNAEEGVEIHVEGTPAHLSTFVSELKVQAPAASTIAAIDVKPALAAGLTEFAIRESARRGKPTTRISPDLPVCERCLAELSDRGDPRFGYPYINCTECGPRYSIVRELPYDRQSTTMAEWKMDELCSNEYHDPSSRRFHAQPVACPQCGPHYQLRYGSEVTSGDADVVRRSAELLVNGKILAMKGIGGYHLVCDAGNPGTVAELRERKFRKEKPFALMVRDLEAARSIADLSVESEVLLTSAARPIVLMPALVEMPAIAPDNDSLGIMLPHAPLHYLLFAAGAPEILVMTSANRSSEPIAYDDEDAFQRLSEIADAFLIGERPIARRVEDSVIRAGSLGPTILRRSRGYAPGAVTTLPATGPILAVGADLKSAVTLVVGGQAFVSQHIGDLSHFAAFRSFGETIRDLLQMYDVSPDDLTVVRDLHPQYLSTGYADKLAAAKHGAIQHHRAHVASVLAERGAWDQRVVGVALDGTGYGDDGSIWGGELFSGSILGGFERVAHLKEAKLAGGDAAAQFPVQAAAGFLEQNDRDFDFATAPFEFPDRFQKARQLLASGTRSFNTTSAGRLFDTVAALLGFTREITFEGQAAIWVEQVARKSATTVSYDFPLIDGELDFRPLLAGVITDRHRGVAIGDIARAFHNGFTRGLADAVIDTCGRESIGIVVASGGVFQNEILLGDLSQKLKSRGLKFWTNHFVPPNDGGISLGQAALAAFGQFAAIANA